MLIQSTENSNITVFIIGKGAITPNHSSSIKCLLYLKCNYGEQVCNTDEIKVFPQIIFQFNYPDREVLILKDSYRN